MNNDLHGRSRSSLFLTVFALSGGLWLGSSCGDAVSAETFEVGTVDLRIGYSPGGGYDTFGRLVARHLGKHLPGNPTIVPQNEPGGGSLKVTLLVAASEVSDGSLIALANPSMATAPLFDPDNARFDPTQLTWIGSLSRESSLCVTSKSSGIDDVDDLLTMDFVVGATGKDSATYQFAALVKNLFDAKYKIVTGYPGGNDIQLAMDRDEVQARCGYSWASLKGSAFEDSLNIIGQIAETSAPDLQHVPLFIDRVTDDELKKATSFVLKPLLISYPFFAPPGLSEERVRSLRSAFLAMTSDSEFIAEAQTLGLEVDATAGDEVQALVSDLNSVDEETVRVASRLVE